MVELNPWKHFYTVIDPLVKGGLTRQSQLSKMLSEELDVIVNAYRIQLPHNPNNQEKIALILLHEQQPYTEPIQLIYKG